MSELVIWNDRPAGSAPAPRLTVRCHRTLRGAYTGTAALLREIVPTLLTGPGSAVVHRHAGAILWVAADLAALGIRGAVTLTNSASDAERTRFYAAERTAEHANGIAEVVLAWAEQQPADAVVEFVELDSADHTDLEFVRILTRRSPNSALTVVATASSPAAAPGESAADHVDTDGTSRGTAAEAAYQALSERERELLHTARAEALRAAGEPAAERGALLYHLARGVDAHTTGIATLRHEMMRNFKDGFYHRVIELAEHGRGLATAASDDGAYWRFTHSLAVTHSYLEHHEEALQLFAEERNRTTDHLIHMTNAYCMSMMYTRHLPAEQHDEARATEWANLAILLAGLLPGEDDRVIRSAFMLNGKALVDMHRGDLAVALGRVERAIAMTDAHFDGEHQLHRSVLAHNRARLLAGLGQVEAAIDAITEVIDADPEFDELYFERAAMYLQADRPDLALADYDQVVALRPCCSEAYYNRADAHVELGDPARAVADLDTAIVLRPDHVDSYLNRAVLRLESGLVDEASADVAAGLALDPNLPGLHVTRGLLLGDSDPGAAIAAFDEALRHDPGSTTALANRAIMRFGADDVAGAKADLDAAIAIEDSPELRINRSVALRALGDHDAAVADLRAAGDLPGADVAQIEELLGVDPAPAQHAVSVS
ncbi:MAG: tetratricopeptide repeat protein [Dermatophilaceae bacterium]